MDRPTGVTILAAFDIIAGIAVILLGIFVVAAFSIIMGGYGPSSIPGLTDSPIMGLIPELGPIIVIIVIIIGVIEFLIAWGLLKGKGWAWYITIIFSALAIVSGLFSLSSSLAIVPGALNLIVLAIDALSMAIDALIIYYFFRPHVKAFFGKGPAGTYQPPATYPTTQVSQAPLPPPPSQEAAQKAPACPRCGQALTWIDQYQRWYCYNCQQYA